MDEQKAQERRPPRRFVTANGFARCTVYDEEPKRGDLVVYRSHGKYGMGIWDGEAVFTGGKRPLRIGKTRELVGVVRDIEV
jgi:hypothetical protein